MNQSDSTTNQYKVTSEGSTWATFPTYIEASNHAQKLTAEIEGISFHVKETTPPTDEDIMAEFSHLDFGVPEQNYLPVETLVTGLEAIQNA